RMEFANSSGNLGNVLHHLGQVMEAESAYADTLAAMKQLAAEFPNRPDYRNNVAGTLGNLANLSLSRRDFSAARKCLEDALPYHQSALQTKTQHPAYRSFYRNYFLGMVVACAGQGDRKAAVAAAAKRRDLGWETATDGYDAAVMLAACLPIVEEAEASFYADQA